MVEGAQTGERKKARKDWAETGLIETKRTGVQHCRKADGGTFF